MTYPNITHHGGATGVTGSCHRLQLAADRALLVDCGLFQGQDAESADSLEQHRVTFPVDDVLALDPYLLAAGYQGPILCSVPSARLLPLVIEDALKVGFTRDRKLIERFLEEVHSRLVPLEYQTWHTLIDAEYHHVRIRLQRAGHILGSAYVEVDIATPDNATTRIVFHGERDAWEALKTEIETWADAKRHTLEVTFGAPGKAWERRREYRGTGRLETFHCDPSGASPEPVRLTRHRN